MFNNYSVEQLRLFAGRQTYVQDMIPGLAESVFVDAESQRLVRTVLGGPQHLEWDQIGWTTRDMQQATRWSRAMGAPSASLDRDTIDDFARIYAFAHVVSTMDEAANMFEQLVRDVAIASKLQSSEKFLELRDRVQLPGYLSSRFIGPKGGIQKAAKDGGLSERIPSQAIAFGSSRGGGAGGAVSELESFRAQLDITAYPLMNLLMGLSGGLFKISDPDWMEGLTGDSKALLRPGSWVNAGGKDAEIDRASKAALESHTLDPLKTFPNNADPGSESERRMKKLYAERPSIKNLAAFDQKGGPFFDARVNTGKAPAKLEPNPYATTRYRVLAKARPTDGGNKHGFYAAVVRMIPFMFEAVKKSGFIALMLDKYEQLQRDYRDAWVESPTQFSTGQARDAMRRQFTPSHIRKTLKPSRPDEQMTVFYDPKNEFKYVDPSEAYLRNAATGEYVLNGLKVDETAYAHIPLVEVDENNVYRPVSARQFGSKTRSTATSTKKKKKASSSSSSSSTNVVFRSKVHPTRKNLV